MVPGIPTRNNSLNLIISYCYGSGHRNETRSNTLLVGMARDFLIINFLFLITSLGINVIYFVLLDRLMMASVQRRTGP